MENKEKNLLAQIAEWAKEKFQASTGWERFIYGAILALASLIILFFFSSCSLVDQYAETSCEWNSGEQQIEIIIKPKIQQVVIQK